MIRPIITLRRRRIIIDVDTQKDFLLADGAACIRNHRRVIANIRRVMAWARLKNIRMISTAQIYNGNGNGNGNGSKSKFCLAGTNGQKKLSYTIRNNHTSFAADGCTDLPREILREYDQVILHKRCFDPFEEPRAERMLSELRADEFVIIGAPTENAVKATALGLLSRNKNVTVLIDAVGSHNNNAANIAISQIQAKGAKTVETKVLCGASCLQFIGVCNCDRCQGRMRKKLAGANPE